MVSRMSAFSGGAICAVLLSVLLVSCGSSSPAEESLTTAEESLTAADESPTTSETIPEITPEIIAEIMEEDTGSAAGDSEVPDVSNQRVSQTMVTDDRAGEAVNLTLNLVQQVSTTTLISLGFSSAAEDICENLENSEAKDSCTGVLSDIESTCTEAADLFSADAAISDSMGCRVYFEAMMVAIADPGESAQICNELGTGEAANMCRGWAENLSEVGAVCDAAGDVREICLVAIFKAFSDIGLSSLVPLLSDLADANCEAIHSRVEKDRCATVVALTAVLLNLCEVLAEEVEQDDCQTIFEPSIKYLTALMDVTFASASVCYESFEEGIELEDCVMTTMVATGGTLCAELDTESQERADQEGLCFSDSDICNFYVSGFGEERCSAALSQISEGCEGLSAGPAQESCRLSESGCSAITIDLRREACSASIQGMNDLFACAASNREMPERAACIRDLDGG